MDQGPDSGRTARSRQVDRQFVQALCSRSPPRNWPPCSGWAAGDQGSAALRFNGWVCRVARRSRWFSAGESVPCDTPSRRATPAMLGRVGPSEGRVAGVLNEGTASGGLMRRLLHPGHIVGPG